MRPIRVISDVEDADREFSPPQVVSEDVWGPPVCLAYTGFNHYEATAPVPAVPSAKRPKVEPGRQSNLPIHCMPTCKRRNNPKQMIV